MPAYFKSREVTSSYLRWTLTRNASLEVLWTPKRSMQETQVEATLGLLLLKLSPAFCTTQHRINSMLWARPQVETLCFPFCVSLIKLQLSLSLSSLFLLRAQVFATHEISIRRNSPIYARFTCGLRNAEPRNRHYKHWFLLILVSSHSLACARARAVWKLYKKEKYNKSQLTIKNCEWNVHTMSRWNWSRF